MAAASNRRAFSRGVSVAIALATPLAIGPFSGCGGDKKPPPADEPPPASTGPTADADLAPDAGVDAGNDVGNDARSDAPDAPPRPDPCRGIVVPVDRHYAAPGLCARVVARSAGQLRQITFTSNGDLWGVTGAGLIRRYRDLDKDGTYETATPGEIIEWGDVGGSGQNCAIDEKKGFLYAGNVAGVRRFKWGATMDEASDYIDVIPDMPRGGEHLNHTVHVFDGWLYVHAGSEGNVSGSSPTQYDQSRAVVRRFDLSKPGPYTWRSGEIVALGVRDALGFARNARGEVYGVVTGATKLTYRGNDVHEDNPGEELVRIERGPDGPRRYGFPFCFTSQRIVVEPPPDAGPEYDAGPNFDAGVLDPDADVSDAGPMGASDASDASDAGSTDASAGDAGAPDVMVDASGRDAGKRDAGRRDAGPDTALPLGLVAAGTPLRNELFADNPYDDNWCIKNVDRAATFFQAHSTPQDIVFVDGPAAAASDAVLPKRWRGGAFVTLRGSDAARTIKTGYKVIWVPFDAASKASMPTSTETATTFPYEVVFGGGTSAKPVDGEWGWSNEDVGERPRFVGVAISPVDGALYVSSDNSGYIYRLGLASPER